MQIKLIIILGNYVKYKDTHLYFVMHFSETHLLYFRKELNKTLFMRPTENLIINNVKTPQFITEFINYVLNHSNIHFVCSRTIHLMVEIICKFRVPFIVTKPKNDKLSTSNK